MKKNTVINGLILTCYAMFLDNFVLLKAVKSANSVSAVWGIAIGGMIVLEAVAIGITILLEKIAEKKVTDVLNTEDEFAPIKVKYHRFGILWNVLFVLCVGLFVLLVCTRSDNPLGLIDTLAPVSNWYGLCFLFGITILIPGSLVYLIKGMQSRCRRCGLTHMLRKETCETVGKEDVTVTVKKKVEEDYIDPSTGEHKTRTKVIEEKKPGLKTDYKQHYVCRRCGSQHYSLMEETRAKSKKEIKKGL